MGNRDEGGYAEAKINKNNNNKNNIIQKERENIERDRQLATAEMDVMKCMREGTEKHKKELDDQLEKTKKKIREMEVINTEIEIKKKDLVKMIRKEEMKGEIEHAKRDGSKTEN